VCQHLFNAHVPVWLVRSESTVLFNMNVYQRVKFTHPANIVMEKEEFNVGQVLKWDRGWSHGRYFWHMQTWNGPKIGIEQFASPFVEEDTASSSNNLMAVQGSLDSGVSRTQQSRARQEPYPQPSTVGGHRDGKQARVSNSVSELWMDPDHSTILLDIFSWHTTFQDVDKDAKRVHANAPKIAYFFPHPALFVNGNSKEWRERYLCNWLVSQSTWITCLLILDPSPVASHCWHDFLNTIPTTIASTHSGCQLQASANLFGPEFIRVTQGTTSEVQFRDITLNLATIGQINDTTKGKILWDLYKHNF
ncbi:hypothetical protein SCLCIDRAFT_129909, partial [Scleroderma citrinum Foug A]